MRIHNHKNVNIHIHKLSDLLSGPVNKLWTHAPVIATHTLLYTHVHVCLSFFSTCRALQQKVPQVSLKYKNAQGDGSNFGG